MDAPTPISINTNENKIYEKNEIIIKKKEYKLEMNKNEYNLIITIDEKYINFKLIPINDIIFIYYINKFDLNEINNKLGLSFSINDNLDKVMKLVDSCFSNNKLSIKFDINKDINIIIKYPILYDEHECSLKLIKTESNINEKFEIILNEISLLKKDKNIEINEKFKNIEKLILDLKDNINKKLEDNLNMINELKDKIEKNKSNLIYNNNIINILKNDIFNINDSKMKNKIYEIYNEDINIGKGFFTKILYNNNLLPLLITNNNIIDKFISKEYNKIIIKNNDENKEIELKDRMKYINKEYNISIIEIKKEDKIESYLELDDNINNNKDNISYIEKTIYILDDMISYGKIKEIKEEKFKYECYIENNSSCLPIINKINNKLIGINSENNKGIFIKYQINEFINIIEFNKKFNLDIIDVNIQELNLRSKFIGKGGLEYLEKVNFKELKELNLNSNNISDIKVLEKVKFDKLEKLYLRNNKISDINILEKVNFKELKELNLIYNNISVIKVIRKSKI